MITKEERKIKNLLEEHNERIREQRIERQNQIQYKANMREIGIELIQ